MTQSEKFNIPRILKEIEELTPADQIRELRRYKAEFLRLPPIARLPILDTPFNVQVDIEIERLQHEVSDTPNVFKVSSKSGAKSDLLQVFYALHKLNLIEKKAGGYPNQKEFLEAFGRFLGEDWTRASPRLSQIKRDTPEDKQTKVFEELQDKWKRYGAT